MHIETSADARRSIAAVECVIYVYADHAQYTIKTYAKMSLFALDLTGGPISEDPLKIRFSKPNGAWKIHSRARVEPQSGFRQSQDSGTEY